MKKCIILAVIILLCILPACGRIAIGEGDKAADNDITASDEPAAESGEPSPETDVKSGNQKEITVSNAEELVSAMAPGVHVFLEPDGYYDLNNVETETEYFSGGGFQNLENVTIEGKGSTQVDFFTDDTMDDVLSFSQSNGISVINLNLGHKPGTVDGDICQGRVLAFYGTCGDITIDDCTMFGCGTVGLCLTDVTDLVCTDSVITDCSLYIMDIDSAKNASFKNCRFEKNRAECFLILDKLDVVFSDCTMSGFESPPYFSLYEKDCVGNKQWKFEPGSAITQQNDELGIRLENVTFGLNEITDPAMKLEKDLKANFPSMDIKSESIDSDYGYEYDISVNTDDPSEEFCSSFIRAVIATLAENPPDRNPSLYIHIICPGSDNPDMVYIYYYDAGAALEQYSKDPERIVEFADYISFEGIDPDFNKFLDNGKKYKYVDEVINSVKQAIPEYIFHSDGTGLTADEEPGILYDSSFYSGFPMYNLDVTVGSINAYYSASAEDASMHEYLEGIYYGISPVKDKALKDFALKTFMSDIQDQRSEYLVSMRMFGDGIMEVGNDSAILYYYVKNEGGEYSLEQFEPIEGD